jgi:acyl-CoA synthetase (AMP-forming)/AMP-acid ligase II
MNSYLHLLGRKDDMINYGGIKVSPLELEAKVGLVFPGLDVCVLGLPDPTGIVGDVPVVTYTGPRQITKRELIVRLASLVEQSKMPTMAQIPCRTFRTASDDELMKQVKQVVAETFDIDGPVSSSWGPGQISMWNSLGHLRLVLAVQDHFGVHVTEQDILSITNIDKLCAAASPY